MTEQTDENDGSEEHVEDTAAPKKTAKPPRKGSKAKADAVPEDMVSCRVLKAGDGKISTGEHTASLGDETFEKGDTFNHPRDLAEELEARGFVEIED